MAAIGYVSPTGDTRKVSKSGDTMTGELTLPDSSPDQALNAAPRGYVDTAVAGAQSSAAADATSKVTAHTGAGDPHGDRAWADGKFATITVVDTVSGTVTTLSGTVTALNGFVNDCLARVAAIEQGTAFLAGLNVDGDAQIANGNLTVTDFTKGYRFRTDGSALDLEATGVDLLFSNWSGDGFNGTQRAYMRLSADAQNVQIAGKVEYVDALYGATRHVIDGAADTVGFHGAAPVGQQTITGSRTDGTALANLLTALETRGDIIDGSSA